MERRQGMPRQRKDTAVKVDMMPVEQAVQEKHPGGYDDELLLLQEEKKRVVSKYKPSRHSR